MRPLSTRSAAFSIGGRRASTITRAPSKSTAALACAIQRAARRSWKTRRLTLSRSFRGGRDIHAGEPGAVDRCLDETGRAHIVDEAVNDIQRRSIALRDHDGLFHSVE